MLAEMKRVARPDGGFFLRDLKRVNDFWRKFYVKVFGFNYDELMKREYNDSIRAAFSEDEWRELFDWLGLKGAALVKKWVTHMGIERPAEKVMDRPVKIPTPLFARFAKNLYVTSPANN
jgi:SAM-dependent methyltransferase